MSTLDRDEARAVIERWWRSSPERYGHDDLLDDLEECVRPFAWQDLEDLLAEHYPEDIFPVRADDPSVDPGPRILALARLLRRTEAKLARIEALCDAEDERWRGLVGGMGTRIAVADVRAALGAAPSNG